MLALLAAAIAAVPAHAGPTQTFTFLGYGTPGVIGQNVKVSVDSGGSYAANYAGRYMGRFNTSSMAFSVFCVDVTHTIDWGGSYTTLALLGKTTTLPAYDWQESTGFYELTPGGAPGGVASAMTDLDYKPVYSGLEPLTTAAARVQGMISKGTVLIEPVVATINADKCSGCRICNNLCPFGAIDFLTEEQESKVNAVLCKGCGTCVAACPAGAIAGAHFSNDQILAEMEGLLWDAADGNGAPAELADAPPEPAAVEE